MIIILSFSIVDVKFTAFCRDDCRGWSYTVNPLHCNDSVHVVCGFVRCYAYTLLL